MNSVRVEVGHSTVNVKRNGEHVTPSCVRHWLRCKALDDFVGRFGRARDGLMGIAILAVVLYHMYCWIKPCPTLRVFKFGYIGVDVFMLASGFGLCYSYKRNTIGQFYIRRCRRIFPLYVLGYFLLFCAALMFHVVPIRKAVIDFVLYSTTLSYWLPFANPAGSWFVPAILLFYLLFPMIFRYVSRFRMKGVLVCAFMELFFSFYASSHIGWYYDCLIGRVPIFLLGVVIWLVTEKRMRLTMVDCFFWLSITFLSLFGDSRFFRAAMICPCFIVVILPALAFPRMRMGFEFLGKHSFEMFLGHYFGFEILRYMGVWQRCASGLDIGLYLATSLVGFAVLYCARQIMVGRLQSRSS